MFRGTSITLLAAILGLLAGDLTAQAEKPGELSDGQTLVNGDRNKPPTNPDIVQPIDADVLPPIGPDRKVICPPDVRIECHRPWDLSDVPAPQVVSTALTSTDDCARNVSMSFEDIEEAPGCQNQTVAIVTRTWIIRDACGQTTRCVHRIHIVDTTPPEITCPPAARVEWDRSSSIAELTLPRITGKAEATDNCDPAPDIRFEDEIKRVGCAPLDISGILLQASSSPEFELLNPPGAVTLQPHAQITLDVAYTPANVGTDTGTIRIESNDPSLPIRIVSLEAEGKAVCEPEIGLGHGGSLDFGDVVVNEYRVMKIAISNSFGCAQLDVSSIRFAEGTTYEFSLIDTPATAYIAPGAHIRLCVRYWPVDVGMDTGSIIVDSNDPDEPTVTISLSGNGQPPCDPEIGLGRGGALDLEEVLVGDAAEQRIAISNSLGCAPLDVSSIQISAGTTSEFSLFSAPSNATIEPGANIKIGIRYQPMDEGTDTGTVRVESNDPDEPVVFIALIGSGDLGCVPDVGIGRGGMVEFGEVPVGTSKQLKVAVSNSDGCAPLELTSLALSGGTSSEFQIVNDPSPITIPPGTNVKVTLAYDPVDPNADAGVLQVSTNDPDEPLVDVPISGSGVLVLQATLALSADTVEFGGVLVGTSRVADLLVTNTGSDNLEVFDLQICNGCSVFSILGSTETAVAPQESTVFEVLYTPEGAGVDTGTVEIASNDPSSPELLLPIWGTGLSTAAPEIHVSTTDIEFNFVPLGAQAEQTVTIENIGSAPLTLHELAVCTTCTAFAITSGSVATQLDAGESTHVTIAYEPSGPSGFDSGVLRILSNDEDEEETLVGLHGSGNPSTADVPFRRSDINADGEFDISDGISGLSYLFLGFSTPTCKATADVDNSVEIDLSDSVYLFDFLFRGGPQPTTPFPLCAQEQSPLGCQAYAPCAQ